MFTEPKNRKFMTEAERDQLMFLFQTLGKFVIAIIISAAVIGVLIQFFG